MSPEQVDRVKTLTTDQILFSLGVVLYELVDHEPHTV